MGDLPPEQLMRRVGWYIGADGPADVFEERGSVQWRLVASLLPSSDQLTEGRVLDFGCGVGRMLRPAVDDRPDTEFWGCDIDRPSVDWLAGQLGGRPRIVHAPEWPPLPIPDEHFDLIYAFSVFTHLIDSWSAWLLELHRLIRQDGLLAITVFGPGHTRLADEPISEDITGMNVLYPTAGWDTGGPLILHSEWWLRAHWGRAFEILEFEPGDPAGSPPLFGQGMVVMRKRPISLTVEDLERPEHGEARELVALKQNVLSLRREIAHHAGVYQTNSWKLTAPLRLVRRRGRQVFANRRSS
jgi:SAM-dependent methyltransferase